MRPAKRSKRTNSIAFLFLRLVALGGASGTSNTPAFYASEIDPVIPRSDEVPRPLYGPLSWFGNGSNYPKALISPGNFYSGRPVVGNDERLRSAIAEAQANPKSKTFTIAVLGGSPVQGMYCANSMKWLAEGAGSTSENLIKQSKVAMVPGLFEGGNYAFWAKPNPIHDFGDVQLCSWPARLARYIANLLLPEERNFVVYNGGIGGCDSMYHVLNAYANFEERTANNPPGTKWSKLDRPLINDVDLILIDLTANDLQKLPEIYMPSMEALVRYFAAWDTSKRPLPTVAFVDAPAGQEVRLSTKPHAEPFHKLRRELAKKYGIPVVDSVFGDGAGAASTKEEKAEMTNLRHSAGIVPGLRKLLDFPVRGTNGVGHSNAAYHEWVAASVFYNLLAAPGISNQEVQVAPVEPFYYRCNSTTDGGRGALLCNLAHGLRSIQSFMDPDCVHSKNGATSRTEEGPKFCEVISNRPQLIADKRGWSWGADVPGKLGWITCNSGSASPPATLEATIKCNKGDLIVGFLRSYAKTMGKVTVQAQPAKGLGKHLTMVVNASGLVKESVFTIEVLNGLNGANNANTWKITFTPMPASSPVGAPGGNSTDRRLMPELHSCTKEKFKLLLLGCT